MKQTLVELLHLAAGLVGTALIARLAAWSVPDVAETIWYVAWAAMLVVVFMAIRPLRLAWRGDRQDAPGADG